MHVHMPMPNAQRPCPYAHARARTHGHARGPCFERISVYQRAIHVWLPVPVFLAGRAGVAKAATGVPIQVLNCEGSGSTSSVLAGLDKVYQMASAVGAPAVAVLSLGGPYSQTENVAIAQLHSAGAPTTHNVVRKSHAQAHGHGTWPRVLRSVCRRRRG